MFFTIYLAECIVKNIWWGVSTYFCGLACVKTCFFCHTYARRILHRPWYLSWARAPIADRKTGRCSSHGWLRLWPSVSRHSKSRRHTNTKVFLFDWIRTVCSLDQTDCPRKRAGVLETKSSAFSWVSASLVPNLYCNIL